MTFAGRRLSWLGILCACLIVVYFLALTYRGIGLFFDSDDVMNIQFLHGWGQLPFGMLLVHSIVVLTPQYRPVPGVIYRALFSLFGFNPLAFHLFCFALLLANCLIAARLFRKLVNANIAFAAVALFAFQPCLSQLYFSSGTLYDILCLTFTIAALTVYVSRREAGLLPDRRSFGCTLILYGLALGSKEMAISFPLLVLAYEIVFHPVLRDWKARLRPIIFLSVFTILFCIIKTQVPNPISQTSAYTPSTQIEYLLKQTVRLYGLLWLNRPLSPSVVWTMLAAAFVLALVLRNKPMIFGFLFANIALLPVIPIAPRAGFVWYLPLAGWALYGGAALLLPFSFFRRRFPESMRAARVDGYLQAAGFCILLLLLYRFYQADASRMEPGLLEQKKQLASLLTAQKAASSTLPKGSRILTVDDGLGFIDWTALFLFRLAYHDPTLWVDRVPQLGAEYDPSDVSIYSSVIRRGPLGTYQVTPNLAQPAGPLAVLAFEPYWVHRRLALSVRSRQFAGCEIDVEYRLPEDELARSGIWKHWTSLDSQGRGVVRIDADAERGRVEITKVRACRKEWLPAKGSFEIWP